MSRTTRSVRIDDDLDAYLRQVTFDRFTHRISHGAYSDIINSALRAWADTHRSLTVTAEETKHEQQ